MTPLDVLVSAGLAVFLGAVVVGHLTQKLFRCPECSMRSDYDHIAAIDDTAPYCPYCGTRTNYVGRKLDAIRVRLSGERLEPNREAGYDEVDR